MAANIALHAPVPQQALGVGGEDPLPSQYVAAEDPMTGKATLSIASARTRLADIEASREAQRRQLALIEAQRPKWLLPMKLGTFTVSSCYASRWGTFHYGVDMAAPWGTPFYAAGDGVVVRAGPATGFGNVIMIEHADGTITVYGHEEKILVDVGENVKAGQLIGLVGSLGESTGPHMHFEIRLGGENGTHENPITWLNQRGISLSGCG